MERRPLLCLSKCPSLHPPICEFLLCVPATFVYVLKPELKWSIILNPRLIDCGYSPYGEVYLYRWSPVGLDLVVSVHTISNIFSCQLIW